MKNNKKINSNYLEYIPYHNPKYESTVDCEGKVTIFQENKGFFYFITQKLLGKPRVSQIHLDEVGNFIWPLIDGKTRVMELADCVKKEYGKAAEPLYDRLVTYLATLERYGFILMKKTD